MDEKQQRWLIREGIVVPDHIKNLVGGHPLVAETLVRRGYTDAKEIRAYLDPQAYHPAPASDLPGMTRAVERIFSAVQSQEKICVWGDFDVDGQTSTTLLVSVLCDLGADVIYHIPVRATESHGIKIPFLQKEMDRGAQLILTCDTGIDASDAVDYANGHSVDVVITDHHELPADLPTAYAILNPHLLEEDHPLKSLPGVGVAYKLAEALYDQAGKPERCQRYLDLVALGIVADVAVQVRDTRYLLQCGLTQLRRTDRLGLQVLMQLAGVKAETLSTTDIGFSIAPRMNALGRLDDANSIVELLTTQDLSRARILASQLESLNAKRKLMTDEILKAAVDQIERDPALTEYAALVLANPSWPPGVIGIVANRLSERYQRPTVLLSTPAGQDARGSARSVHGCHITDAIATQTALLATYGGHAQAAGLSLRPENIPIFRRGLSRAVLTQLGGEAVEPPLIIDDNVSIEEISLDLVDDLERLSPFGPGNPALNLALRRVRIVAQRKLGRDGRHLRITVADGDGDQVDVYWWQWEGASLPTNVFDLAVNLNINHFKGKRNVQPVWLSFRLVEKARLIRTAVPSHFTVVDYRAKEDVKAVLDEVLALQDSILWREGLASKYIPGKDRLELYHAANLIVWTPPASYGVFREIITLVKPERVILADDATGDLDQPNAFLRYLTGLVKYAMQKEEETRMITLAAAMGHNLLTIRKGLAWLAAQGFISLSLRDDDYVVMEVGGEKDQDRADYILDELQTLLSETAAYRRHYSRMDAGHFSEILGE